MWYLNNPTTRAAGGADCIWSGMNSGSITAMARSFRDLKALCARADIVMLDHQRRDDDTGFQQNGDTGKRVHGVLGWHKLAPESMAMYESGPGYYRVAAKPAAEARHWMIEGLAGGIQPWWHHVAAYHEDRRMYRTAEPVMAWCERHQQYLIDRTPIASVGVVWSQQNTDFFGRDDPGALVDQPYTGFMHALVRARIPYLPVHVDDISRIEGIDVLVLPNIGALSDAHADAVRRFVERGGAIVATGRTSLYTEWGDPRADYALADLFQTHWMGAVPRLGRARADAGTDAPAVAAFAPNAGGHTYLRLTPELRARVDGPHIPGEPAASGVRHRVLDGLNDTDIVAFGGLLVPQRVAPGATVLLTYVPPFPTYPPETAWMREPVTDVPGLVIAERGAARIVFMPADLDRRYALEHLPDHARLLANVVRWAARERVPVQVDGTGLLDCHLYRQPGRLILHVVNLTSEATWRAPLDELIKVGPFAIRLSWPPDLGAPPQRARLLVANTERPARFENGFVIVGVDAILDHEVLVLG